MSLEKASYPALEAGIAKYLAENKLIHHPAWALKIIQLYETQVVRHGIMILGPSGTGKSTCITVLQEALSTTGVLTKQMHLNPKSITDGQMFGKIDSATNDWTDGIFSSLWRRAMKVKKGNSVWLILDGPVDPNWIENLNSVLDENRILTLANGDRLPMPPNVKLIFEPQNVDNASPATVSRCGMVYMSSSSLDWQPLLASWLMKKVPDSEHAAIIKHLFESSFPRVFRWSNGNLMFMMPALQVHVLHTMFVLLEALLPCLNVQPEEVLVAGFPSRFVKNGRKQ